MWYDFEFQVTFSDGSVRDVEANVGSLTGPWDDPSVAEVTFYWPRSRWDRMFHHRRRVTGGFTYDVEKLEELTIDRYLIWRGDL